MKSLKMIDFLFGNFESLTIVKLSMAQLFYKTIDASKVITQFLHWMDENVFFWICLLTNFRLRFYWKTKKKMKSNHRAIMELLIYEQSLEGECCWKWWFFYHQASQRFRNFQNLKIEKKLRIWLIKQRFINYLFIFWNSLFFKRITDHAIMFKFKN